MTNEPNDVLTVDFEPFGRRARVAPGTTLLEAARQAGVGLNGVCGGAGTCGTCRVRVVAGQVTPTNPPPFAEGYGGEMWLACQTRAWSDVRVDVPPSSITAPQRAQIEGRERPVALDPAEKIALVPVHRPVSTPPFGSPVQFVVVVSQVPLGAVPAPGVGPLRSQ